MAASNLPLHPAVLAGTWGPLARDLRTGHFWHMRQRLIYPLWNSVQCGVCGLHLTDYTLMRKCQGYDPDRSYLFEDEQLPADDDGVVLLDD